MRILTAIGLILALAACSNVTKEKLGLARQSPDETRVEQKAPLSLPPEFNLRPVAAVAADEGE